MKLIYEEDDNFITEDKLFKMVLGDVRFQIGIKKSEIKDDWEMQRAIRGARQYLLSELAELLFGKGWQRIDQDSSPDNKFA